jgi:hypothetical protein
MTRKIKVALLNNKEDYQQMHVDASLPSSMAMSFMTNSVFSSCDVWSAFNKLAAYNIRQDNGLAMIE